MAIDAQATGAAIDAEATGAACAQLLTFQGLSGLATMSLRISSLKTCIRAKLQLYTQSALQSKTCGLRVL